MNAHMTKSNQVSCVHSEDLDQPGNELFPC